VLVKIPAQHTTFLTARTEQRKRGTFTMAGSLKTLKSSWIKARSTFQNWRAFTTM